MPSVCAGNIRKHVLGIFRYPAVDPKTLHNFSDLSTTPDESPPPFQRPIHYTRRKPSEPRNAYPPRRVIPNRLFEEYSEAVRGSIRSIECTSQGVYDSALRARGTYAIRPYLTDRKSCP